jgi:hypothetical protein
VKIEASELSVQDEGEMAFSKSTPFAARWSMLGVAAK